MHKTHIFLLFFLVLQPIVKAEITQPDKEISFVLLHADMDYGERTWRRFNNSPLAEKEKLLPLLCAGVNDPDERVRENAVGNLLGIGEKALPCLTQALDDKSDGVKFHTLMGLPKLTEKDSKTQEAIIKLLESGNPNIRRTAIETLGKAGFPSKEAISALKQKYNSNDDGFRSYAACALANIGDLTEALPLLQKDLANNVTCIGWLGPKASQLIPGMVDLAKKDMSYSLVIALGRMGKDAEPALPLLVKELLYGKEPRWAAAGIINIGVATDDVLQIIDRIGPHTRLTPPASFASFGEKGAQRIFPKLMEIRKTSKEKEWIDTRLYEMSPYLKPELLSLFKSSTPVDSELFRIIAKSGPKAARPIASYLKNKNNVVRLNAVNALKEMGPQAADVIPELIDFIRVPRVTSISGYPYEDLNARTYAYETVGRIGKKALPYLQKILTSDNPETWAASAVGYMPADKKAVELILPFTLHPNKDLRLESIRSVARMHAYPSICIPALIKALDDTEIEVSDAAIVALEAYGPRAKSAIPALKIKLSEALKKRNTNRTYILAHALNTISVNSKETDKLVLSALLRIDPYGKLDQISVFQKIGQIPEEHVKAFFNNIPSLSGADQAVTIERLINSRIIKDKYLIDLLQDNNSTIASAAYEVLCETGTEAALKACREYASSDINPYRDLK